MINGFIKLPRSLLCDELWKDLSLHCRMIFIEILSHVCFRPQKYDDHGFIIELKPGEVCASIREILKWCGKEFSKNDIERSIKKLILCQFLRQEVRHYKLVLSISHLETLRHINNLSETENETVLRQFGDSFETQKKKDKNVKKEKEEKEPSSPKLEKIAFREFVLLTQQQHDTLLAEHGFPMMNLILDTLDYHKGANGKKYVSDFHAIKKWVVKAVLEKSCEKKEKTVSLQKERILDHFKNGEIYNGAECNITGEGIAFDRGMKHGEVKFNAFGFDDQLRNLLNQFGVVIPLNSNGNVASLDQRI